MGRGGCPHFFGTHPGSVGLLQCGVFISVSMKGLSPVYNIFSANHEACLSTMATNSVSLCQNIIILWQGIVVFLPSEKPGP